MTCYAEQTKFIRPTEGISGMKPFCVATSVGFSCWSVQMETRKRKLHFQGLCEYCGKEMRKPNTRVNHQYRFCSVRCRAVVTHKGKRSKNWKGGRKIDGNGYVLLFRPHRFGSDYNGYVTEHRLVMSLKTGRFLTPQEVVHHINGDRADNSIENLQLMSRGEHNSIHLKGRTVADETKQKISKWHKSHPSPRNSKTGQFMKGI